jgi:flagellar basal-body rod protein FlgC
MNLISSNLANVNSTRTNAGGPYKRKDAVFQTDPLGVSFRDVFETELKDKPAGVRVIEVAEDPASPILKYDPSHPDADEEGYVRMPNINLMDEMVNMINATRSYEAGVTAINATKDMALKALDIGK